MPTARINTLNELIHLVGDDAVTVVDPRDGWPSLVQVKLSTTVCLVSLHVGPIKFSYRERDDVERRFQNPGQDHPVMILPNSIPLLIGIWDETPKPVLVSMGDVVNRVGKNTRQSLFIPLTLLEDAATRGWADHESTSYERLTAFHPRLFPAHLEMISSGTQIPIDRIISALDASGINEEEQLPPAERGRRATTTLIRDARFKRNVVDAYDGLCAMCGLNLGLVEGAHIYPASAPQSPDEVWNGIALCSNHHGAFDKQLIHVNAQSRIISMHPGLMAMATNKEACRRFIDTTYVGLARPKVTTSDPRSDMFEKRYKHYGFSYAWAHAA